MTDQASKKEERITFLLIAVFLAPALTGAIIGIFGFTVWMSQLIMGPPSAPM